MRRGEETHGEVGEVSDANAEEDGRGEGGDTGELA